MSGMDKKNRHPQAFDTVDINNREHIVNEEENAGIPVSQEVLQLQ
jgi:hypothetical protein